MCIDKKNQNLKTGTVPVSRVRNELKEPKRDCSKFKIYLFIISRRRKKSGSGRWGVGVCDAGTICPKRLTTKSFITTFFRIYRTTCIAKKYCTDNE